MLADTLTVQTGHETAVNYDTISVNGSDTIRRERTSSNDEPRDLIVRHSTSGKPGAITDRTLISFSDTVLVGTEYKKAVVNLTFALDRGVPQGTTDPGNVRDMFCRLISLCVPTLTIVDDVNGHTANLEAILRGQS
jgi:hypothetical protein